MMVMRIYIFVMLCLSVHCKEHCLRVMTGKLLVTCPAEAQVAPVNGAFTFRFEEPCQQPIVITFNQNSRLNLLGPKVTGQRLTVYTNGSVVSDLATPPPSIKPLTTDSEGCISLQIASECAISLLLAEPAAPPTPATCDTATIHWWAVLLVTFCLIDNLIIVAVGAFGLVRCVKQKRRAPTAAAPENIVDTPAPSESMSMS